MKASRDIPSEPISLRLARAALGWALAIYVAGNLLMTTFAPMLHDLTLTVEVVDEATGAPIPGATVGWVPA